MKMAKKAEPYEIQKCGYKCLECPYPYGCLYDSGTPKVKLSRPPEKPARMVIKMQTYPAPEWKYRPRHLT